MDRSRCRRCGAGRPARGVGDERPDARIRQAEADDPAGEGKGQAFRQQFPGDAARARAERGVNGQLLLPRLGSHQEEIRDVRARDQQDEARHPEEDQQQRTRVLRELREDVGRPCREARVKPVRHRVTAGMAVRGVATSRGRLLREAVGFRRPNTVSALNARRFSARSSAAARNGQAEVGMNTSLSTGYWGTAGRTPTIACGRSFICSTWPTTVGFPPNFDSQYAWLRMRTAGAPGGIVAGHEVATDGRRDAERSEEVGRHHADVHAVGFAVAEQDERHLVELDEAVECGELLAVVVELGDRHADVVEAGAGRTLLHEDEPLAVGEGQRLEQHAANDAEDGRVRADAEGQRENGDQREHGGPEETPGNAERRGSHREHIRPPPPPCSLLLSSGTLNRDCPRGFSLRRSFARAGYAVKDRADCGRVASEQSLSESDHPGHVTGTFRANSSINIGHTGCTACLTMGPMLSDVFQDVRFGLRLLRRSPVFTTVAVSSLALGIGGAAAVFSLLNAIVLRNLPVAEPDRLFVAERHRPDDMSPRFSWLETGRLRDELAGKAELAAASSMSAVQLRPGRAKAGAAAERGSIQLVSGEDPTCSGSGRRLDDC